MRAGLPRILVVDANPGYRSVISHVVEMAGAQFESVAEIGQGMRQLDGTQAFDMIIVGTSTDSPLSPAAIGKLRSVAEAPVIVLIEAYDETKETLRFYKAGADEVLPKPFVPDALIGAIHGSNHGLIRLILEVYDQVQRSLRRFNRSGPIAFKLL